jgi:DNA adenine methylase
MNPWNFTKDDVVYCDPPYLPLSNTAKFTDYSPDGFTIQDHEDLAALALAGPHKVIISNHDTPLARELYKAAQIIQLDVNRYISAKGTSRGKVSEILAVF